MLVSEIDDCSICPLMEEGICNGITGGPNGYVEPPCASWDDDEDTDDIIESYYAYEAYQIELEKKEQKKRREANEKSAKSAYVRMMTRGTTSKIKELKKKIASVKDVKFRVSSMSRAFSIVDSMFNGGNVNNEECDLSQYDKLIEGYEAVLTKTELELKAEREKVRKSVGYRRAGLERKPIWGSDFKGAYWYEHVIDYVSVKTDKLMKECMGTLNKSGFDGYLIVFIIINGKYHMYGYNGDWIELGYLDDLNPKSRTDKEFKKFIASLLYDIGEGIDVIVMPSRSEYGFFSSYPACYKSLSDFKKAWTSRFKEV